MSYNGKYKNEFYIGREFNRVKVVSEVFIRGKNPSVMVLCECANGDITKAKANSIYDLLKNRVFSCGCYPRERYGHSFGEKTHGESETRLYGIWKQMKKRCNNPNDSVYKYYGKKGVRVCDEWNKSYESFRDWALNNGYNDQLTIDRKDSNGNYESSNRRCVTQLEQIRNISRKNFSSRYMGVLRDKRLNKWMARIQYNKKQIRVGTFESEKEAALAYNRKAKELFGDKAYQNIIEEDYGMENELSTMSEGS